jgi:hypothetical protein
MRFFFLFLTITIVNAYNILIYPGSQVSLDKYNTMKDLINKKVSNSTINFKSLPSLLKYKNDTILIGHSFGGYFSLLDAKYNNDTVKGVILLNSHFNSRGKMPYPRIDMKKIKQPVLTILGDKDERLPFKKAIDDLFYRDKNYLEKKYFIINNNFTHFTGIGDNKTEYLSDQICNFIENINNYTCNDSSYSWYNKRINFQNTIDIAFSLNMFDAIFQICNFPFWQQYHYLYFLTLKPENYLNYQYSMYDYILLKTQNTNFKEIINDLNLEFSPRYNITWNINILPTVHPSILVWLMKKPYIKNINGTFFGEIIMLPVNENVTYYKVPNKIGLLDFI